MLQPPTNPRVLLVAILALAMGLAAPAASAQPAGKFIAVVGDVQVIDGSGRRIVADTGAVLEKGDTVVTGPGALAQLRLSDGGLISVRAETRFTLDDYSFKSQTDRLGRLFVNLLKGSLRSLTGLIGKSNRDGYRIKTPHATIGVRGTDHETAVITEPQPGGYQPGTYDVVFAGQTFMRTRAGIIEIPKLKGGYVAAPTALPKLLPQIPDFMKNRGAVAPQARVKGTAKAIEKLEKAGAPSKAVESVSGETAKSKAPLLINPLLSPTSPKIGTSPTITTSPKISTLPSLPKTTQTLDPKLSTTPTLSTTPKISEPLISPTITTSPTLTTTPKISEPLIAPTITTSPTLTSPTLTTTPKLSEPIISPTTTTSPTLSPTLTTSPTTTIKK